MLGDTASSHPEPGGLAGALRAVATGNPIHRAVDRAAGPAEGPRERTAMWKDLRARQLGMVPELWDLVNTPGVTDVLINGPEVWVDRGGGCVRAEWGPESEAECRALATQLAAAAGKRLDDACPLVDAFLGHTVRLHAVIPPLARDGTAISLRVLRQEHFSFDRLVDVGTIPPSLAPLLGSLVLGKVSMLISGATGAGKTTLLAALLGLVPADQRIVCIEEVSELFPDHEHVVHLQERQANVEGAGAIPLVDLVRAALRMRPDRLVLGECRGAEIREVLTALNSGHAGFSTIHAGSVEDVPTRLAALGALAGMSEDVVRLHASAAFRVVLQMGKDSGGLRRLRQVGVLVGGDRLECRPAFDCRDGQALPSEGARLLQRIAAQASPDG